MKASSRVPGWVDHLAVPTWVSGPEGTLLYINDAAERLLGVTSEECVGRPCHVVVGGESSGGQPFCLPDCPLRRAVRAGRRIQPYTLKVRDGKNEDHWIRVLVIPVTHREDGSLLVHCAARTDRTHRMEEFLGLVASRSSAVERPVPDQCLTPRELQIIRLLARDETMQAIAEELNLSYVTVRNHVQHILFKLDAHSTLEAVARFVLRD